MENERSSIDHQADKSSETPKLPSLTPEVWDSMMRELDGWTDQFDKRFPAVRLATKPYRIVEFPETSDTPPGTPIKFGNGTERYEAFVDVLETWIQDQFSVLFREKGFRYVPFSENEGHDFREGSVCAFFQKVRFNGSVVEVLFSPIGPGEDGFYSMDCYVLDDYPTKERVGIRHENGSWIIPCMRHYNLGGHVQGCKDLRTVEQILGIIAQL